MKDLKIRKISTTHHVYYGQVKLSFTPRGYEEEEEEEEKEEVK